MREEEEEEEVAVVVVVVLLLIVLPLVPMTVLFRNSCLMNMFFHPYSGHSSMD